jgi:hypothetical protein
MAYIISHRDKTHQPKLECEHGGEGARVPLKPRVRGEHGLRSQPAPRSAWRLRRNERNPNLKRLRRKRGGKIDWLAISRFRPIDHARPLEMLFRVKPNRTFSTTSHAFGTHKAPMNSTQADLCPVVSPAIAGSTDRLQAGVPPASRRTHNVLNSFRHAPSPATAAASRIPCPCNFCSHSAGRRVRTSPASMLVPATRRLGSPLPTISYHRCATCPCGRNSTPQTRR